MFIAKTDLEDALSRLETSFSGAGIQYFKDHLGALLTAQDDKDISLDEFNRIIYTLYQRNVDPKIIDKWARSIIENFNIVEITEEANDAAGLLFVALNCKLTSLATFLVDNDVVLDHSFELSETGEKDVKPLFFILNKELFDETLFDKMLAKETNVNHATNCGRTALYIAIQEQNDIAVEKLLNHRDVEIVGSNMSHTLFDEARENPALYNRLMASLDKKFVAGNYDWQDLITVPIAKLNTRAQRKLQEKLFDKMEELDVFKDEKLKEAFSNFIIDTRPLPFKGLNRLAIAFECVSYLVNYSWVNQHDSNLCGPAVFMQALIANRPDLFIYSVMEMVNLTLSPKQKNQHLPDCVEAVPKHLLENCEDLAHLWLETIRHNYNIFLNYSTKAKLEALSGATAPAHIELMFKEFSHAILCETMQIKVNPNIMRSSTFFDSVINVVFNKLLPQPFSLNSKIHEEIPESQRLSHLQNLSQQHPNQLITVLINKELLGVLLDTKIEGSLNLPFEDTHYINLSNFRYNGNKVSFNFYTYGSTYEVNDLDADIFQKGYRGALLAESTVKKKAQLKLETADTNSNDNNRMER